MNGLSKSWRGLLVLAGASVSLALAPAAGADPGGELWTTRPLSDANYAFQDDRIPNARPLSDASFTPEQPVVDTFRHWAESPPVALNRVLSDARYQPKISLPAVSSADDAPAGLQADQNRTPLIVGLLAIVAGAGALIIVSMRSRLRPAI